jgi:DNA-binding transcriptional ArsR family regulator
MMTFHLKQADLAQLRFFYRPLSEIPMSYRILINPEFQSLYHPWVDQAKRALYGLDLPYLGGLIGPHGYLPDFLLPLPHSSQRSLEDSLVELEQVTSEKIIQDILTLIDEQGDSEIRRFFLAHPQEALECLIEDMRVYWKRAIEPYWQRIMGVMESDILFKGRTLALDGHQKLFPELHPTIRYDDKQLLITPICAHAAQDVEFHMEGSGVQLVPSLFGGCGRYFKLNSDGSFQIAYRTHGTGLWLTPPPDPGYSLEQAFGAARAQVLTALMVPAQTTELARKLHLTAGTVSQHLSRLTEAGLVTSHRQGKRVYYQLSRRAEKLLDLFDTPI